jgi:hypothetical protein
LCNIEQLNEKLKSKKKALNCETDSTETESELCAGFTKPLTIEGEQKVDFDDVVGQDEAVSEIRKIMSGPYKYPKLYPKELSKYILLYGPPGTGKTLVAKAIATEIADQDSGLEVLFYAPQGDEFRGKMKGDNEKKTRQYFVCCNEEAKKRKREYQSNPANSSYTDCKAIICIDEFDSIAKDRGQMSSADANNNVITTLLQNMGPQIHQHVMGLFITNKPWDLDKAILDRIPSKFYMRIPKEKKHIGEIIKQNIVFNFKKSVLKHDSSTYVQEYFKTDFKEIFDDWKDIFLACDSSIDALVHILTSNKEKMYSPRGIKNICQALVNKNGGFALERGIFKEFKTEEPIFRILDGLFLCEKTHESLTRKLEEKVLDSGKTIDLNNGNIPEKIIVDNVEYLRYLDCDHFPKTESISQGFYVANEKQDSNNKFRFILRRGVAVVTKKENYVIDLLLLGESEPDFAEGKENYNKHNYWSSWWPSKLNKVNYIQYTPNLQVYLKLNHTNDWKVCQLSKTDVLQNIFKKSEDPCEIVTDYDSLGSEGDNSEDDVGSEDGVLVEPIGELELEFFEFHVKIKKQDFIDMSEILALYEDRIKTLGLTAEVSCNFYSNILSILLAPDCHFILFKVSTSRTDDHQSIKDSIIKSIPTTYSEEYTTGKYEYDKEIKYDVKGDVTDACLRDAPVSAVIYKKKERKSSDELIQGVKGTTSNSEKIVLSQNPGEKIVRGKRVRIEPSEAHYRVREVGQEDDTYYILLEDAFVSDSYGDSKKIWIETGGQIASFTYDKSLFHRELLSGILKDQKPTSLKDITELDDYYNSET